MHSDLSVLCGTRRGDEIEADGFAAVGARRCVACREVKVSHFRLWWLALPVHTMVTDGMCFQRKCIRGEDQSSCNRCRQLSLECVYKQVVIHPSSRTGSHYPGLNPLSRIISFDEGARLIVRWLDCPFPRLQAFPALTALGLARFQQPGTMLPSRLSTTTSHPPPPQSIKLRL